MTSRTIWIDCDSASLGGMIRDRDGVPVKISRGTSVTLRLTCMEDGAIDTVTTPATALLWLKSGTPMVEGQPSDESELPLVEKDVASSLATVSVTQYSARSASTFTANLDPDDTSLMETGLQTMCLFATKSGPIVKTWLSGQFTVFEDAC